MTMSEVDLVLEQSIALHSQIIEVTGPRERKNHRSIIGRPQCRGQSAETSSVYLAPANWRG